MEQNIHKSRKPELTPVSCAQRLLPLWEISSPLQTVKSFSSMERHTWTLYSSTFTEWFRHQSPGRIKLPHHWLKTVENLTLSSLIAVYIFFQGVFSDILRRCWDHWVCSTVSPTTGHYYYFKTHHLLLIFLQLIETGSALQNRGLKKQLMPKQYHGSHNHMGNIAITADNHPKKQIEMIFGAEL